MLDTPGQSKLTNVNEVNLIDSLLKECYPIASKLPIVYLPKKEKDIHRVSSRSLIVENVLDCRILVPYIMKADNFMRARRPRK